MSRESRVSVDRTLGDLPVEGGQTLKATVIPVVQHYSTGDPLS